MPFLKKHSKRPPLVGEKKPFEGKVYVDKTKELHKPKWRKFRQWYLNRNTVCVKCRMKGKTTEATVVDHIKPRRLWPEIDPYAESNLQALCGPCHNSKTAREAHCHTKTAWQIKFRGEYK